jgi:uncharacterized RDD family membrane protein YckC
MAADEFEYVGFWARVGASVIDTILVLLLTAPLIYWFYGADQGTGLNIGVNDLLSAVLALDLPRLQFYLHDLLADLVTPRGPLDVLINWVLPAVAIVVFWIARGATPGKMAIGARVVDARTGKSLSVVQSIVRYAGYYVSTVPLLLGLIWVAFDPRKQGWHDKLAGTVVVRVRRPKHCGLQQEGDILPPR